MLDQPVQREDRSRKDQVLLGVEEQVLAVFRRLLHGVRALAHPPGPDDDSRIGRGVMRVLRWPRPRRGATIANAPPLPRPEEPSR